MQQTIFMINNKIKHSLVAIDEHDVGFISELETRSESGLFM